MLGFVRERVEGKRVGWREKKEEGIGGDGGQGLGEEGQVGERDI